MFGSASSRSSNYRPELDGLRFFAFLAVFAHHALPREASVWMRAGFSEGAARAVRSAIFAGGFGVDLFFCLSSFLITRLLLQEVEARGAVDVRRFWTRRALRIWPLYITFVVFAALPLMPARLTSSETLSFLFMAGNWHVALFGYPHSVAAPLWSISIEEQFYVLWPLILRRATRRRIRIISLVLLGVAAATRFLLAWRGAEHPAMWTNTFARLDPIALGSLAATIPAFSANGARAATRWAIGLGVMGAMVALASLFPVRVISFWHVPSYLLVALCCLCLLWACLESPRYKPRLLTTRATVYLGKISYGLYVFHVLGLKVGGSLVVRLRLPLVEVCAPVASLLITVLLAGLSYRFLETPFLRLKERFAVVQSRPI